MSWLSDKTGRPKEEGGHERINISVDDFTAKALEKVKENDGNVSKFIEKELQPVLKGLDPGKASNVIYQITVYVASRIVDAAQKEDYETVKALTSVKIALSDHMKLAGVPPLDFELEKPSVDNRCYSPQELTLAINHSKNLVYGLDTVVFLASLMPETFEKWKETPIHPKQQEISILTDAAEQHLKTGYPSLYAEIVEFRNLICEEERITAELQKKVYFEVDSYGPSGLIGRYLTCKESVEKKYRKKLETLVGKLPKETLETIKEMHNKESMQIVKLDREMKVLALQIENGEPLHGTCNLCPTIKVAA